MIDYVKAWEYLDEEVKILKRNMKSSDERYRIGYNCALSMVQGLMNEAETLEVDNDKPTSVDRCPTR
jgi:hypothetical protein